jgi:hypothetical protein
MLKVLNTKGSGQMTAQQTTSCSFESNVLPKFDGELVHLVFIAIPLDFDVSSPLTSRVEGTPRSGARGTPVRQRPDLGSARKGLQVDLQSDGVSTWQFPDSFNLETKSG